MATLVYKMTHDGDPDQRGCWGVQDCMGQVRELDFNAVIGIGGLCWYPRATSRTGEIVWIGIGPYKTQVPGKRGPVVRFDYFILFGEDAPMLRTIAPNLAQTMYRTNRRSRWILYDFRQIEQQEIEKILELARGVAPANQTVQPPEPQEDGAKRRRSACRPMRPRSVR